MHMCRVLNKFHNNEYSEGIVHSQWSALYIIVVMQLVLEANTKLR